MNLTWTIGAMAGGMVAMAGGFSVAPPGGPCPLARDCPLRVSVGGSVDVETAESLRLMWLDEMRAQSFYAGVIARFGEVRPFANIVLAEAKHAATVEMLMRNHGVARPAEGPSDVPAVPATLAESFGIAVSAERANIELYTRLLDRVAEPDIRAVMEQLRSVSQNNHLRAFERGGGGRGAVGRGARPGSGRAGQGMGPGAGRCGASCPCG